MVSVSLPHHGRKTLPETDREYSSLFFRQRVIEKLVVNQKEEFLGFVDAKFFQFIVSYVPTFVCI